MKKINIVLIGVGLFFICLGISILTKEYFEIETDYLSAFATLFAAIVAIYLYSDWKEPHKALKILSERNEILLSIRQLRYDYYQFICHVRIKEILAQDAESFNDYKFKYAHLESNLLLCLDVFRDRLHIYIDNLIEDTVADRNMYKPRLNAYLSQVDAFYNVFMEHDPLANFDDSYAKVADNLTNGFFKNIALSLTEDLRTYLISLK